MYWTVDDSMSTIPPSAEEDSVEEEAEGVGDDASAMNGPRHANMDPGEGDDVAAVKSEISGAHLPGQDLSLFEWTQLLQRPDDPSPLSSNVPAAATSARRRQQQVLEKILPDDEDRPVDWTSSLWSNITPNPWWSPPPSRSTTTTPVHDKKNHDQNYNIDSSAGCGLSVRRGTHGPPVVSSHHYCSAHWERQMML
jgi:hypothetical protein